MQVILRNNQPMVVFTYVVSHSASSISAAYNVLLEVTFPEGLVLASVVTQTPRRGQRDTPARQSSTTLRTRAGSLLPGETITVVYTMTVSDTLPANLMLNNVANLFYTNTPQGGLQLMVSRDNTYKFGLMYML